MKKSKKNIILFCISFVIAVGGVFLLSFYLTNIVTYMMRYNNYSQTQGTIVGYTIAENNKKAMVINYNINGTDYQILSTFSNEEPHPVGYSILVRYDKEHPNIYILGDEQLPFVNTIIGIILSVIGIGGMIVNFKVVKKNDVKEDKKGE